MAARRQYTQEEKDAYWAARGGRPARGSARGRGYDRARSRKGTTNSPAKKRSGCTLVEDYKEKNGNHTGQPMLWGWRISKRFGFQSFSAYLDKNGGAPRNGTSTDECLVFVVNLETEGIGKQTLTGVWSKKYKKLSITSAGLVANPNADRGGYFGRGGSQYKDKVNK
jgi:hypothetical protein